MLEVLWFRYVGGVQKVVQALRISECASRARSTLIVLFALVIVVACGDDRLVFPAVDGDPAGRVAGVVWLDDGDGAFESGETLAEGAQVRIGNGTQTFFSDSPVVLAADGAFVLDLPAEESASFGDLFVEVSVEVAGPGINPIATQLRQSVTAGDVGVAIGFPEPSTCAVPYVEAVDDATSCGELLLPDLVPLVDDFGQAPTQPIAAASARIDTETRPGRTLLRFASATANLGAGPLHMIPDVADPEPSDDGTTGRATWQRIWTSDRRFVDRPSGEFVYHPGHDHFHVDGFEQYRLLTVDGEVVAIGEKISFCLIDSLPARTDPQRRGLGVFLNRVCEDAADQQALNPGWADYYGAGLDDQWIDITGAEPGGYVVEIVVDPDGVLAERDETNNRATFPITIPNN